MATLEKDIVVIHFEDEPLGFAQVLEIKPDVKKGWYIIKLMLLNTPVQIISWILRDAYIDGEEFTMGGHKMWLEKVEPPKEDLSEPEATPEKEGRGKIVSFKKQ